MVAGQAERVTPSVTRVLAPNPSMMTLAGTNSYLVGDEELVVIDAGPNLPEHVDAIVAAAARLGRLAYSLVTHHHDDHLPAALRLRERLGTPIAGHADLPSVDRLLTDDEVVAVDGARLRAITTPGHTRDHVCYFLEQERALFTGDLIAGSGTIVLGAGRGDLADYMQSLERVARLDARLLLPGHGPIVERPDQRIQEYLDHRRLRERQIVESLQAGAETEDELVARLYVEVDPQLHPMAARNVRAHLYKLEWEGRARQLREVWRLVDGGTKT